MGSIAKISSESTTKSASLPGSTEPFNFSSKLAYADPKGSRTPLASGTLLGEDYVRRAEPILCEQMARAGVRLANELNSIFH